MYRREGRGVKVWRRAAGVGTRRHGGVGGDALYATLLEGGLYLLEVLEVMRRVLLCMLEVVEGELCLRGD